MHVTMCPHVARRIQWEPIWCHGPICARFATHAKVDEDKDRSPELSVHARVCWRRTNSNQFQIHFIVGWATMRDLQHVRCTVPHLPLINLYSLFFLGRKTRPTCGLPSIFQKGPFECTVVACSWVLQSVIITAGVSFIICAWWYIFLYSYPKVCIIFL